MTKNEGKERLRIGQKFLNLAAAPKASCISSRHTFDVRCRSLTKRKVWGMEHNLRLRKVKIVIIIYDVEN